MRCGATGATARTYIVVLAVSGARRLVGVLLPGGTHHLLCDAAREGRPDARALLEQGRQADHECPVQGQGLRSRANDARYCAERRLRPDGHRGGARLDHRRVWPLVRRWPCADQHAHRGTAGHVNRGGRPSRGGDDRGDGGAARNAQTGGWEDGRLRRQRCMVAECCECLCSVCTALYIYTFAFRGRGHTAHSGTARRSR
mmetsp:Transcript_6241/g.19885  ORF Transcript_6241/g.19885 Transcript_6241/m.19885 type:complete len:200 (+) Transcript_6241:80-679(+)